MADPIRCDNWDRLLLGMSLFAGEDFDALELHPYRNTENEHESVNQNEINRNSILSNDNLTAEQRLKVVMEMNKARQNNDGD